MPKHASDLPQKYSSFELKDNQHQIVPVDLKSQISLQMFWLPNSPEAGLTVWMSFYISAQINSCLTCNFFCFFYLSLILAGFLLLGEYVLQASFPLDGGSISW